jgi:myo-inositol-1-phosphate synthase
MSIKVGIVGVGNCAKSLVEAVVYFKTNPEDTTGLAFPKIGGYTPADIQFLCAFDVDQRKVGLTLGDAIYTGTNCAKDLIERDTVKKVLNRCQFVYGGPMYDGVAPHMLTTDKTDRSRFCVNSYDLKDSVAELKLATMRAVLHRDRPDVMLLYLPVGSQKATEAYVNLFLELKIPFVNCIPVFIVSDEQWKQKIIDAGICAIGDDMRSQVGASVLSQVLQEMFISRGAEVDFHCQQNSGGNTDFLNMTDKTRLISKKISKENVINSVVGGQDCFVHAGPSDYVEYLGDKKVATIRIEARGITGVPIVLDARLEVQDSPNSAGIVIDAIRYLKRATELGIVGPLYGPSAATQKTPPKQLSYADAYAECKKLAES